MSQLEKQFSEGAEEVDRQIAELHTCSEASSARQQRELEQARSLVGFTPSPRSGTTARRQARARQIRRRSPLLDPLGLRV